MNVIELQNVEKKLGNFHLGPLDLVLPQGSILGLMGENGAGKTTLLRLLVGRLQADAGSVSLLGTPVEDSAFLRTKEDLAVVWVESCFPDVLHADDVGRIMAQTYRRWDAQRYEQFLSRFSLPKKQKLRSYSHGMHRKLSLAVTLSHPAKLLLLDEPTAGLDPMIRDEILELLNDFTRQEDHSVILASHIVSDLEKICDYVAILHEGRLLYFGEKDRLLEEYALVSLTKRQLDALPPAQVVSCKENPYGAQALLRRADLTPAMTAEHSSLEDILLHLMKGAKNT